MVSMLSLLIPIGLSAVLVFIASSVVHMLTPLHKHDLKRLSNEDAVMNALRPLNIPPGDYGMPMPSSQAAMKSPEFQAKYQAGPVGFITMRPSGRMSMTANLVNWFIYCVVVSFFTAYVCSRAMGPATEYLRVFQIAGCVSFMGYWLSLPQNSIWWSRSWGWTFRSAIDGLLYACLTGGSFGWLWPR